MPTLEVHITASNQDGAGGYSGITWPPPQTSYLDYNAAVIIYVQKYVQSSSSWALCGYMRFDTSALPDTATITDVVLHLYHPFSGSGSQMSLVGDYYDYGGGVSTAADWVMNIPGTSIFTPIPVNTVSGAGWLDITLTDLTGINTTGFTGIRLAASDYTPTEGSNHLNFESYDETSTNEPWIEITYTVDSGNEVFTIASDADDGGGAADGQSSYPPNNVGTYSPDENTVCIAGHSQVSTVYWTDTCYFRWDTSVIPDDAFILAVRFKPYVTGRSIADTHDWYLEGEYYDFGGEASTMADWVHEVSSPCFSTLASELTTSAVNTITLTDLTGINKTGFTGLRVCFKGSMTPTGVNTVSLAANEHASAAPAVLEVDWSLTEPPDPPNYYVVQSTHRW